MNFESTFFEEIVKENLFYNPRIEIKPVHLANGFFRAVCGWQSDHVAQHRTMYPSKYPDLDSSINLKTEDREMLYAVLGADGAIYGTPNFSSYTLSHVSHITSDNHDRGAGEWLRTILERGMEPSPAFELLRRLLMEDDRKRSDELSTMTLPLSPMMDSLKPFSQKLTDETLPQSLRINEKTGNFADPLITIIRQGFDQLARYDEPMAFYGGKLDTLRDRSPAKIGLHRLSNAFQERCHY